ncbi:MAG: carbohydrate-binding family 9-like protein [Pyrinomonadaceae bacterium]
MRPERETGDLKIESGDAAIAHWVDSDLLAVDMDHPAWTNAPAINLSRYWSGEEAPSNRHAEARIVWSEEAIVVRFLCPQAEPLIVSPNPQTDRKAIGLWDRDVCELFVAPDPDEPNRYFEFEAAPTGEWIDLAIDLTARGRETDWDFHSGMTAAAHVTKHRILIAMRIPWSLWIHKPQRGDRWRANLFRCVGIGEERGYIAWNPTRTAQPDFHVPDAFGWLHFS